MLRDPARFDLRGALKHGRDVGIVLRLSSKATWFLGERCESAPSCVIKTAAPLAMIGRDQPSTRWWKMLICQAACTIETVRVCVRGAELLEDCTFMATLRRNESGLGKGSKAGHLSTQRRGNPATTWNIGAGAITCNFDGANRIQNRYRR